MRRTARAGPALVLVIVLPLSDVVQCADRSRPVDRTTAIGMLRAAVEDQHGDAQRMLGSLVEGTAAPGAEALRLYLAAQRNGDANASARVDLLRSEGMPMPFTGSRSPIPDDGEIVPIGRINDDRAPGYHCHYFRAGQMWCHGGID